jgi:hypothetical protein
MGRSRRIDGVHSPVFAVACALAAFACARADAAGLWGAENLLSPPRLGAGDTVTVVLRRRTPAADAASLAEAAGASEGLACARCPAAGSCVDSLAGRVVKVLPNGDAVVEVRARFGDGYVLVSGQAARGDVSVDREVDVARLSNLAIVARRIDPALLGEILRLVPAARVAAGPRGPGEAKRR